MKQMSLWKRSGKNAGSGAATDGAAVDGAAAEANGLFERGVSQSLAGDYRAAEQTLTLAVATYRALPPGDRGRAGLPRALWRLSLVQGALGQHDQAVRVGVEAAALWQDELDEADREPARRTAPATLAVARDLARGYIDLSVGYQVVGNQLGQISCARQSVDLAHRLVAGGHADGPTELGTSPHNLATALSVPDRIDEALIAINEAVDVRSPLAPPAGPYTLAHWELANSLRLCGQLRPTAADVDGGATALFRSLELSYALGPAGEELKQQVTALVLHVHERYPDAFRGKQLHLYAGSV